MSFILDIPKDIWIFLITEWIDLCALSLLEIALCNKAARFQVLSYLESPIQLSFNGSGVNCMRKDIFDWIQKRGIKLRTLTISNFVPRSFVTILLNNFYFDSVKVLTVDGGYLNIWDPNGTTMFKHTLSLIEKCRFLDRLHMTELDFQVLDVFRQQTLSNTNLKHLRIHCFEFDRFNDNYHWVSVAIACFPNLQSLDLSGTKCLSVEDCFAVFLILSSSLTSADVSYCVLLDDTAVTDIAVNCPKLQRLKV